MQRDEVRQRVVDAAVELLEVDADHVADGTAFADLGLDSLVLVEYALRLEDAFDVEIPEEEVAELKTVGDLVDALVAKTAVRSAGLEV